MDGQCLEWEDINSFLNIWTNIFSLILVSCVLGFGPTSQAAQPELVYLVQRIWVLPVVLYDVDVIRGGEEASEAGGVRIP
jgi:hypothetical protein